jgi:tRNA A37 methylthiotransferase MiaB
MLENMTLKELKEKIMDDDLDWNKISKDEITNMIEKMKNMANANCTQDQISILNAIKKKVQIKINQNMESFAHSVLCEEKDHDKAQQCTSNIKAYDNMIDLIDEYITEIEFF